MWPPWESPPQLTHCKCAYLCALKCASVCSQMCALKCVLLCALICGLKFAFRCVLSYIYIYMICLFLCALMSDLLCAFMCYCVLSYVCSKKMLSNVCVHTCALFCALSCDSCVLACVCSSVQTRIGNCEIRTPSTRLSGVCRTYKITISTRENHKFDNLAGAVCFCMVPSKGQSLSATQLFDQKACSCGVLCSNTTWTPKFYGLSLPYAKPMS